MTFSKPELWITKQTERIEKLNNLISQELINEWQRFLQTENKKMILRVDRITGKPSIIEGEGIPWIPGWVNNIKAEDLGLPSGTEGKDVPVEIVKQKAVDFLNKYPKLFNIDPLMLSLNQNGSGPVSDYLYNIYFNFKYFDIPVEKAHISFHLNNGNLVQFGQEYICDSIFDLDPNPKIKLDEAWNILWNYIGGKTSNDEIAENGKLSIVPVSTEEVLNGNLVLPGNGLKYKLVWTISFLRDGIIGTWEAKIDAHNGEILSFNDINYYGQIKGTVYTKDGLSGQLEVGFPFADYQPGLYADINGNFEGNYGICTMTGRTGSPGNVGGVKINDNCGPISLTSDSNGIINFGSNQGTDCSTPGYGGQGNTWASRTQYWNITKIKMRAYLYFNNNEWLENVLTSNVNITPTGSPDCNAYWAPSTGTLNFFKSTQNECRNAGEFPGIAFHEFGNGLDANDGSAPSMSNPAEAYADIIEILEFKNSCLGDGFRFENCYVKNDPCISCTGVRDVDWAKHQRGEPWIFFYNCFPDNFCCVKPKIGSKGPCQYEDHCESQIVTQAFWDLVNREFIKYMSLSAAWDLGERLFYNSARNLTNMYECSCSASGSLCHTEGCSSNSLYNLLRVADDNNGDLSDGTPHEDAIFDALHAHCIACMSEPDAPTLTDECSSIKISWDSVRGAGWYSIYRREGGCGSDGWVEIATSIEALEYTDTQVQPGKTYGYYISAGSYCGHKDNKNNCSEITHSAPDISGLVLEYIHDCKPQTPLENPVNGAIIEDLTYQLQSEISGYEGFYKFQDVQGGTYKLHAYKIITTDNDTYTREYKPLPYRSVSVCKADVPNQNFWIDIYTICGILPAPIPINLSNIQINAISENYSTAVNVNQEGYYNLLVPEGTYQVMPKNLCNVFYPPYLTVTISDSSISNINFQIIDWQVCDACYATLYREQKDCGLLINPEECIANSIIKFKQCAMAKTQDENSYLYNAIILSVEVQRAKGSPEWQNYEFQVQNEGDYFVNITNGDLFNQETACSSAEINLTGYGNLFGPSDFNKNVFELKKEIHLTPGNYTLEEILRSQPGCYITIVISNKDVFSFQELP